MVLHSHSRCPLFTNGRFNRNDHGSDRDYATDKSTKDKSNKRGRSRQGDSNGKDDGAPEGNPKRTTRQNLHPDKIWDKIWKREDEIDRLRDVIKDKNDRFATFRDDEEQKVKEKNSKLKKLKADAKAMDEQVKELKKKLLEAEERVHERDVTIKDMCNERIELLSKGDIPAQPDDVVAVDLAKLFRRSKKWASTWSVNSWASMTPEKAELIGNTLQQGPSRNFASDRIKAAILKGKIAPKIIVNALCNGTLCVETFIRPLDILKFGDTQTSSKDLVDRLSWVSTLLHKRGSLTSVSICLQD